MNRTLGKFFGYTRNKGLLDITLYPTAGGPECFGEVHLELGKVLECVLLNEDGSYRWSELVQNGVVDNHKLCFGIHPKRKSMTWGTSSNDRKALIEKLREESRRPGVVAIGEIGLDYNKLPAHSADQTRKAQRRFLDEIMQMISKDKVLQRLPIVIHCGEDPELKKLASTTTEGYHAAYDIMRILRKYGVERRGQTVYLHSYSGDYETAQAWADFKRSFVAFGFSFRVIPEVNQAGHLCYKRDVAEDVLSVFATLNENRILVETDAPLQSLPSIFRKWMKSERALTSPYSAYAVNMFLAALRRIDLPRQLHISAKNWNNVFSRTDGYRHK